MRLYIYGHVHCMHSEICSLAIDLNMHHRRVQIYAAVCRQSSRTHLPTRAGIRDTTCMSLLSCTIPTVNTCLLQTLKLALSQCTTEAVCTMQCELLPSVPTAIPPPHRMLLHPTLGTHLTTGSMGRKQRTRPQVHHLYQGSTGRPGKPPRPVKRLRATVYRVERLHMLLVSDQTA